MAIAPTFVRLHPRARAAVRSAWILLACACSGVVGGASQGSQGSQGEARADIQTSSATTERRTPAIATPAGQSLAESARGPSPPESGGPLPILNAEVDRLRQAARQQAMGRDAEPGDEARLYALGRFVPIENEAALDNFHSALARLAAGDDEDGKVRILAYGASHTQADSYTGYLRAYLQRRFGDGGQGFMLLGRVNRWYGKHETKVWDRGVHVVHARYRTDLQEEPLGLFGAAAVGRYGGSYAEIITSKRSPNTRFELHYFKQPGGGDFSIQVDGKVSARIQTSAEVPGLGYHSFETSPGRHRIRAQLRGNGPVRLFGVSVETAARGVVVDTLGISGAQMTSNVRWHEETWLEALRHRKPDLVMFAYGTNEVMDPAQSLRDYELNLRAVLIRLRKAAPEVSCVLMSPFDLPARVNARWSTNPRLISIIAVQRRLALELGCGFWDGYKFMGGAGSMHRWVLAKPPLASIDHVHLTRRGYVFAGMALGDALMRSYDANAAQKLEPSKLAEPSAETR